jgi:signal peptidase I
VIEPDRYGPSDPHALPAADPLGELLRDVPASAPVPMSRREARAAESPPRRRGVLSSAAGAATEVVVVLVMALVLSLLIKTFLVQAFYIPSDSMQNTLERGDRVLVSKLTPGPFDLHHGDVIVFKDPGSWLAPQLPPDDGPVRSALREALTFVGLLPQDSGEHLIKRVVGLPGDRVACCDKRGRVTIDGVGIDEPYLYSGNAPSTKTFDVVVPAGKLWVMGDHREVSEDSRYHPDNQFVPIGSVVGKAFVIVWPLSRLTVLSAPSEVFANVPDRVSTP